MDAAAGVCEAARSETAGDAGTASEQERNGRAARVPDDAAPPRWACAASCLEFPVGTPNVCNSDWSLLVAFRMIPLADGVLRLSTTGPHNALLRQLVKLKMSALADPPRFAVRVRLDDLRNTFTTSDRSPIRVSLRLNPVSGMCLRINDFWALSTEELRGDSVHRLHIEAEVDCGSDVSPCAVSDVSFYRRDGVLFDAAGASTVVPDAYYPLDDAHGTQLREAVYGEDLSEREMARVRGGVRWWSAPMGLEPATGPFGRPACPQLLLWDAGRRLLREGPCHDVCLVPEGDPDAEPVRAHRAVLAFHSEYLRALFQGGESRAFPPVAAAAGPDAAPVVVPACDAPTLRTLVDVLYGLDYEPRFVVRDPCTLFARWGKQTDYSEMRAPRHDEPRYRVMVAELVALAHVADALRVQHLLDACTYALTKPRMMRSPAQVVALLGALPRPCGGGLAVLRERCVAWLAFRQRVLERLHPAWAQLDGRDREEIERESLRMRLAHVSSHALVPDAASAGGAPVVGDRLEELPAKRVRTS